MALSGVNTYIPTIREFLHHWNEMNLAVGDRVTLAGGFSAQDLEEMGRQLGTCIQEVNQRDAARTEALKKKDTLLVGLRERVKQFRAFLASQLPDSPFRKQAPTLPTFTAAGNLQLESLGKMIGLWEVLNGEPSKPGFNPPLKLAAGYTIADAKSELSDLRSSYGVYTAALSDATAARARRTELMKEVAVRLRQYRQAAVAYLPTGHPLLEKVPAVAPTGPSTVPGVELTGEWDTMRAAAVLSWSSAPPETHERFEVRFCSGAKYKESDEQVVGSVLKGVLSVITDYGLATPGAEGWFRVYNITTDGEEKGSNAIKVSRP